MKKLRELLWKMGLHKKCPSCGGQLTELYPPNEYEDRFVCKKCGWGENG